MNAATIDRIHRRFRASSSSSVRGQSEPSRRDRLRSARTLPASLAAGAVVRFFVGIADAQNLLAAARTRQAIAAVNGHIFAESGHFLGEALFRFRAELSIQSCKVCRVASKSLCHSSGFSLLVSVMGESCAACRISSE